MSADGGVELNGGQLQNFTIDQAAGAFALTLGAVGTLLLVIWQSRCLCKCRLGLNEKCELFYCERQPPPEDEDKDKDKKKNKRSNPNKKKKKKVEEVEEDVEEEEEPIVPPQPEPEPEPEQLGQFDEEDPEKQI